MVDFNNFGTTEELRRKSRQKKAEKVDNRMATTKAAAPTKPPTNTAKPTTNTAGKPTKPTKEQAKKWFDSIGRQMNWGMKQGGLEGGMAGFMGMPFMQKRGDSWKVMDPISRTINEPGSRLPRPTKNPKPTVKPPTNTAGIDAPAPDTGWRPSGVNTASGLQQTKMGVPLQETVGVSKRRR